MACGPVTEQEETPSVEKRTPARRHTGPDRARVFLATTTDSKKPKCVTCDGDHQVDECDMFNKMGLPEKNDVVMKHGLCRGCLQTGHIWRTCKKRKKCEQCFRWHPTVLHDDSRSPPQRNTAVPSRAPSRSEETQVKAVALQVRANDKVSCSHTMIVPVRLEHADHPEHQTVVYALLDPQSDACFIKESVGDEIRAGGEEVLLELSTMAGKATMKTTNMKNLIVRPIDSDTEIKMPATYSRVEIPAERHLIPKVETVRKWPHLEAVSEQLPPYFPGAEVGLLIGMNCPRAIKPRDIVPGDDEDPWAVRTDLGWSVVGHVQEGATAGAACRHVSVGEGKRESCHFAFRVHAQEVNPIQIATMLDADKYEDKHGEEAANFIRKDFYVDDGLTSTPDADSAVRLVKSTVSMCEQGGFKLHKFVSNDSEVMSKIPPENRSKNLQNVEIGMDHPLFEQALGIKWNASDDMLHFNVDLPKKPSTRRGVLSMVSSLYDPLGLLSPFMLRGKCILKQLCCDGASWDEAISEEVEELWNEWKNDTQQLPEITVPRCYIPRGFGRVKIYELHHFSDASMDGCGQCSYLRVIDEAGKISSRLVMSKTKVTPKRPVTVPRLELTAAVMSVKTSRLLRKELDIQDVSEFFWTDSKVVLGYIHNESRRFHVYVANRVQQVRGHTSADQWRYVKSQENPADLASRGLSVMELKDSRLWWSGPSFLTESAELLDEVVDLQVDEEDPEVKSVALATRASIDSRSCAGLPERLERFSSWFRAKRAVAVCLRYKQRLCRKMRERASPPSAHQDDPRGASLTEVPIRATELREAEQVILKSVQSEAFAKELKSLTSDKNLQEETVKKRKTTEKQSDLHRLDPLVSEDGLLRVGGRLRRGGLSTEVTHPVILPKRGHVTDLIVSHFHEKTQHGGRDMTLSEIRSSGFWIIRGRMAAARHILRCVKCRRLRGTPCKQKMADLPAERLQPTEPFTYTGVDYFGPFYVRERRSEVKRWGVLFTCLNSRAIHLETANSLTTDAFLNAYRRFVSRRGPVKRLYCDNGTNFVGGKRELESALKEMDVDQLRREMLKDECDLVEFKMNVPHASHMGGVWERQIRSARAALTSLLDTHGQHLDDELLRTLMTEAESIVNSRPLSYCSMTNTNTIEPITPNQLLTLKSKVVAPLPGRFCKEDLYARQRWRRVQHLATLFWTRWRQEFLPTLQERRKWTDKEPNLEEGDVVLVMDNNAPRSSWPLGRIVKTYPSADHLVRKAQVQIGNNGGKYDRPVHCLIALMRDRESRSGSLE